LRPWADNGFIVRDQRIVGAVANIRLCRQIGLNALLGCDLADVLWIVETDRVERFGDQGELDFDVIECVDFGRLLIAIKRIADDLCDDLVFEDAVSGRAVDSVSDPAHLYSFLIGLAARR